MEEAEGEEVARAGRRAEGVSGGGGAASEGWSAARSAELYDIDRWSGGYFSVSEEGHVLAHPSRREGQSVDLVALVSELRLRDLSLPILLRFGGILADRVDRLHGAFATAIDELGYDGDHAVVFPIKVNQQRQVVERIHGAGRVHGFGLEAGSKPELLAVLALTDASTPVVCNGFKDAEYIEAVLLAQKMGRTILPVVERFEDLSLILDLADTLDIVPELGIRLKLASRGAGRWRDSAGYRSKFGLTVAGLLEALEVLRERDRLDSLRLVHFHIGSQITNIRQIKSAVQEATRVFVQLKGLGARNLDIIDVGGGLGVDYDGSQTDFDSSMNYSLQEYANDVVHHVQLVCDEAEVPHPKILTESGRALTAYHSVLLFNVLGRDTFEPAGDLPPVAEDAAQPLCDLRDAIDELASGNLLEAFHDGQQALEEALNLFGLGYLSLEERGLAESLYWRLCYRVRELSAELDFVPEELGALQDMLPDIYFCNFSVFQSLPDSWAIQQLFPVLPIQRLDEQPSRQATLADISCDSDGKLDRFIGLRETRSSLPVHHLEEGETYVMGAFLIGAYQEILGDLHNLFGDTHAVNIEVDDQGRFLVDEIVHGETVEEVLRYVQFDGEELFRSFRRDVERAVHDGRVDSRQAGRLLRFYRNGLRGYTYLEDSFLDPE